MVRIKPSKEELEVLYSKERLSVKRLSERFHVANDTVKKWILSYNIDYRNFGPRKISKDFVRPSKEQLDELYNKEKLTLRKIGEKYNVTKTTVKRWFNECSLKVRSDPQEARLKGTILPSKEQLIKDYESLFIEIIAKKYGISTEPILTLLDRYGLQKRNRMESKRLAEKTGRFVSWNKGKGMDDPKVAEMMKNLHKRQMEKMDQIRIKQSIIKKKLFLEKPELRGKMAEMGLKSRPKYVNTKPEKLMRKILELWGLTKGLVEQYHLTISNLRTRQDFAYPEHKLAIYCDGDFLH